MDGGNKTKERGPKCIGLLDFCGRAIRGRVVSGLHLPTCLDPKYRLRQKSFLANTKSFYQKIDEQLQFRVTAKYLSEVEKLNYYYIYY